MSLKNRVMGSERSRVLAGAVVLLAVSGAVVVGLAMSAPTRSPQLRAVATTAPPAVGPAVQTPVRLRPLIDPDSPAPTRLAETAERLLLPTSNPVSIEIPVIGVDSPLQPLGLTADNRLEVPVPGPHYDEAAWYKYSTTPGARGPAVILGHVDSAADGPSVFFDLGSLEEGDEIFVTRTDGQVAVFGVDEINSYPKTEFPTLLVYGEIDHSGLRLITCGGEFESSTGQYLDNIVVFASLVDSLPSDA